MVGGWSGAVVGEDSGLPGSGARWGPAAGREGDRIKATVSIRLAAASGGLGGAGDDTSQELPGVAGILPTHCFLLYFVLGIALHL